MYVSLQGNFLLFEAMLNSVVVARDRFLKEGGLILPSKCTLFVAPVDCQKIYERRIDFWSSTKEKYDLSMECMIPFAKKRIFGEHFFHHSISVIDFGYIPLVCFLSTGPSAKFPLIVLYHFRMFSR